jgi:hypothetical protein
VPTLYSIAAATLGNGSLFMEIFNLNKGRLQPNGQRLEDPHSVEPGWILLLPPGASGPGVHLGPLPSTAKASGVVRQHSARSQAAAAASTTAASAGHGSGSLAETVIGGALLVVAAAGLGLVVRRRRRSGSGNRHRKPTHAMDAGPGGDWVRSLATDTPGEPAYLWGATPGAGPSRPASDHVRPVTSTAYQGRPTGSDGPDRPYPDHPSWPASGPGRPVGANGQPVGDPRQPVGAAVGYGQTTSGEGPDWLYPDHPSWPANGPGSPLTPDHPSWPATDLGPPVGVAADYGRTGAPDRPGWPYPDHPSWPASGLSRPLADDDDSGWPATDPRGDEGGPSGPAAHPGGPPAGGGADLPRRERLGAAAAPGVHHDPAPRQPVTQVPPARGRHVRAPVGYSGRPGHDGSADDAQQRWSAQLARTTGPIPQTYYDLAFGDARLQVVLTEAPGADQGWGQPAATNVLQLTGPDTGQQNAVAWHGADPGNADAVRVARQILSDADQHAAEIRLEAAAQAAAIREAAEREAVQIREQAAAETAPIREGAEREAAVIRETADAEAAAIREAAEQGVNALRSAARTMLADLDQMAAYITERFTGPIERITGTKALPAASLSVVPAVAAPAGAPSETPSSQEETYPGGRAAPAAQAASHAMPATAPARPRRQTPKPAAKPARRTETPGRSRQFRIMRVFAGTIAALVVLALGTGAYQLATRGYTTFVFRSAGTGATDNNAVFPGIIPTPKPSPPHHNPTRGAAHGARGPHHGARGAHHGALGAHHHHHRQRGNHAKAG